MPKYTYLEVIKRGNQFDVPFRMNATGLSVREQERAWAKIEQRYPPSEYAGMTVKTTEVRHDRDFGPVGFRAKDAEGLVPERSEGPNDSEPVAA